MIGLEDSWSRGRFPEANILHSQFPWSSFAYLLSNRFGSDGVDLKNLLRARPYYWTNNYCSECEDWCSRCIWLHRLPSDPRSGCMSSFNMKWSLWRISFSQDLWMKWIPTHYCFLPGLTRRENRGTIDGVLFLWGRDRADKSKGSSTGREGPYFRAGMWVGSMNSSSSWYPKVSGWGFVVGVCVYAYG